MYRYRPVQVVSYCGKVRTTAALCHAKYAQSLYLEVDQVAGLWCHCNVTVWECCGHNPVLSTYCIRTAYVLICTQYILSTYCVCTSMYLVLVHTCFCFWALLYRTRLAGVAATSMRSTRGCGCLDVSSLDWAAWQMRRLRIGRILPAKRLTSVRRRLVMATSMMVPEMKCELELYEYVLVQT